MALISGRPGYDRARILDAAARARAGKKRGRAIELYRWVLALEPKNVELHAKLAPLLAETGQHFDAWRSFKTVARVCLRDGQIDKALAIYRDATLYLPREVQAWHSLAHIHHRRGRGREAIETLLEGSRQFRSRWLRPQAIHLLRSAREIDPWDFEVLLDLSKLLASSGQRQEARILLSGLAQRCRSDRLRRVRGTQLRVSPGVASAVQWLRATLRSTGEAPSVEPQAERNPGVVSLHAARLRK